MSDIAIRVEGLSKAYRIGLKEQRHETLAGAMASFVRSPFENFRNLRKLSSFRDLKTHGPEDSESQRPSLQSQRPNVPESQSPAPPASQSPSVLESQSPPPAEPADVFWALKDVSFEVKHGEVLGIIGRNGAGKSTLLKILSRITEPTIGRATIYGRVASLLEVGTGFHPDLTGRENVYLNGTILGMRKREIDAKFDEIVAFSEVEKFIDTPVKRYSSGMRVRLAFAVAAHLDPEILIVDEVLAVGDLNFQRKCLGKMGEVAQQGRTVLFVSHNLGAVTELCHQGLVLEAGKVKFRGDSFQSVDCYVQGAYQNDERTETTNATINLVNLRVNQSASRRVVAEEPLVFSVSLRGTIEGNPWMFLIIEDASGSRIVHSRKRLKEINGTREVADCTFQVGLPPLNISPGVYSIYFKAVSATVGQGARAVSERLPFEVRGECECIGKALLAPRLDWRVIY